MIPGERELARIRFVTSRFTDLRGLTIAGTASSVLLPMWTVRVWLGPAAMWWALIPSLVLAGIVACRLEERYNAKCGRVRQCGRPSRFQWGVPLIIGALTIVDSALRGDGYPSALFLVLASGQAWVAFRDWPWRRHYFAAAALTATAAALYSGVTAAPQSQDDWLLTTITLTGLGAIFAGLLDHQLLASTLKPRSDSPAEEKRAESA